ncbi:MAG: CBS domain-containing protein [Pirellulales bacterium]|nr:CBS domain-containing protein [Pirellulales bacterium]
MKVSGILREKGGDVFTTQPEATLEHAIRLLVEENVGSLVVVDPVETRRIVGIITERDILRTVDQQAKELASLRVADYMSTSVKTCTVTDTLDSVMGLMTTHRVRHMPIVEDDKLCGMVSIGDIVKAQHDHLHRENYYLKEYIHQ